MENKPQMMNPPPRVSDPNINAIAASFSMRDKPRNPMPMMDAPMRKI